MTTPPDQVGGNRNPIGFAEVDPPTVLRQGLPALVAQQPFFKGLNALQVQLLADSALEVRFETGQTIFDEGSPANRFYLILEGKVVLESEKADRSVVPIQTLQTGDDLGWSWLFPPYSLVFSARALEPTKAIFFYGTRLREQCEADHELGYQLMKRIAEVAAQRLQTLQRRLMENMAGTSDSARSGNTP